MPRKIDPEKEHLRLEKMKEYEYQYSDQVIICGVDEAGRGPLAGPVAAGAVILPREAEIFYLNDSKKLTEKRRDELYDRIEECAIAWNVAIADHETIDLVNILQADYQAMRDAGREDFISIHNVPMEDTARYCRKEVRSIVEGGADALLCATNAITIQCLRHIKDSDIRIPDDLALVGFDGGSVFDFFYAPLTYFEQPLETMARKSVDVLVEMLESGQGMMQQIEVAGKLIVRESSARKKQNK